MRLDKEVTQAMIQAEKQVIPAHTAPWSPQIHTAYLKVQQQTHKIKQLERSGKTKEVQQMERRNHTAIKELQTLRKCKGSLKNQVDYLEDKADIYELKGQGNRVAIIRSIIAVEELREKYRHIRYAIREHTTLDLTQVQYPTQTGWKTTKNPTAMEESIFRQYSKHFTQANTTPVAREFHMGTHAENDLYENFENNQLPDMANGLKSFFACTIKEEISTRISMEDVKQGIKNGKNA